MTPKTDCKNHYVKSKNDEDIYLYLVTITGLAPEWIDICSVQKIKKCFCHSLAEQALLIRYFS